MKILYVADNINHHMIPISNEISNIIGVENFKYAVLKPTDPSSIKIGYSPNYEKEKWVISAYKSEVFFNEFEEWFRDSDVVMFSCRSLFKMAKERISNNRITFYFSERWWKPPIGRLRLIHPKVFILAMELRMLSKNSKFHYLAQGGYAATDLFFFTNFQDRIWDFGYFTDVKISKDKINQSNIVNILWCGRMVKWKRVDTLIKAFSEIFSANSNCFLTLVGYGNDKERLEILAKKMLPYGSYTFIPPQPFNRVREFMSEADIYVLPSSGYEGWGAVINEAMAEGCVVIASKEAGGAKSMINHLKNGILFNSGDWIDLSNKIKMILDDENLRLTIRDNGLQTVNKIWSPKIAADRLLKVFGALLENEALPIYKTGPMRNLKNR